jgi:hypothetical protein
MSRRVLAWFLSVPLIVAGVEGGHWLAYRVVYPDPYLRAQALTDSGHRYLSYAPVFFAIVGAVALCAFGLRVFRRGAADLGTAQVSLLPFVFVSPLAFALQECIERLFVGGWPFGAVLAPTFMPGLLFQLPFALVAFLLARWLLRAADRLRVLVLGRSTLPSPLFRPLGARAFPAVDLQRRAALAGGVGERGPPWVCVAAPAVC